MGSSGSRVRGSLSSLLERSAAVVRGSASVAAIITARIDRLRPSQQLTLKVALVKNLCLTSCSRLAKAWLLNLEALLWACSSRRHSRHGGAERSSACSWHQMACAAESAQMRS